MSAPPAIRLVVVDDHPMARSGIGAMLARCADIEVVGEAAGGHEAMQISCLLRPDVMLMDLALPDTDGFEATRLIHAACPEVRVIAVTGYRDEQLVHRAVAAGMAGYVLKACPGPDLARAVRAAAAGQPAFSLEAMQLLIQASRRDDESEPSLTRREDQVVAFIMQGLSNRQIAERLVVSHSTVKFYVRRILAKLGATNRTDAVARALERRRASEISSWAKPIHSV